MEWHFRLDGDDFDISGIKDLVRDEVRFHEDNNGSVYLVMDLGYGSSDATLAINVAEERLALLNASSQIAHGNHFNVRIGSVSCPDDSGGPRQQFAYGTGAIRSRSRVFGAGSVVVSGGLPQPSSKLIGDRYLDAAKKDALFERALYLFGSLQLNWRGLYMVLEVAEDAHGGEKGLIAKNLAPAGQIKDFKATANSYKALKLESRHGSTTKGPPNATITPEDALLMVRTILEKWGKGLTP
jgi:hypothetical protein